MNSEILKPDIYWVGAIDWAIRDFHGYITPRGSTYNNYLIVDRDITLIDAVKIDFVDVSIENIKGIVEPSKIKNIVVNHIEPDHASGLGEILKLCPTASIYCTEKGKKGLERFFDIRNWNINIVKTGDTLNIGSRTLLFIETPMIHWPDSMMTYIKEDKILISQDGFGQHIASSQRFDDEFAACASFSELEDAVWDYYANILMPFGTLIRQKIHEIQKLGLEIEIIAPDHGVIWRKNPQWIIDKYLAISEGKAEERAVVIYDSMWHNTEKIALFISEGIREAGMDVRVIKLRATPLSVAIKEFWRARGCLLGSPTLNNAVYPKVGEFLTYLRGLRPKNRIVGAFGSFGWGGGAVKEIYEDFKKMGLEIFEPGLSINYKASSEEQKRCREFGREFAERLREYHKKF